MRIFNAFKRGFTPAEKLSPADWAERNVEAIPYSPIPGPFRVANSPMTRAVMDAIVSPRVRTVVVSACIQSGKTLAPELALAYIVRNAPGPAMWLDITDESAKDQGEGRLRPLFENCPPVRELFNADKNKMRNRTMIFANGMTLWVCGAKNKRNLQRRSIRWLFGDETWLWEPGRMAEAEARVAAFGYLGKCVFMSQGSFEGDDTDKKFRSSDAREWCFRCPRCGEQQPFVWENLRFDSTAKTAEGERDFRAVRDSVRYVCPHCGGELENSDALRRRLNASACFVPTNLAACGDVAGFHWNALATTDWGLLAEQFLRAKDAAARGDVSDLQAFVQKRLAKSWKEDDETLDFAASIVPEGEFRLREPFPKEARFLTKTGGIVPAGTRIAEGEETFPLRFMTVDVQDAYFVWAIRSWSAEGDSRLFDCGMAQSFDELRRIAEDAGLFRPFVFLDCGFRPESVFAFCAEFGASALRGDAKNEWRFRDGKTRFYSPCEKIAVGRAKFARRYFFSNTRCKDILAALRAGKTSARWEIPLDAPENYLRQISAEIKNPQTMRWEQIGKRANHFFDCETMQIAVALMLKIIGKESS